MMNKCALMVTIVPPFPDDQGNRVVTRNVMDVIISCGYKIDMVLQGNYDQKNFEQHFKEKAKVFRTNGRDNFKESVSMTFKKEIQDEIRKTLNDGKVDPYQESNLRELFLAANQYHPFSFISDETVNIVEKLVIQKEYDFILCNYIYCLRVVSELRNNYNLPPVITITHDAISRLNKQALEYGINTEHRACSASIEAECLNYSDVVCCITNYEQKYFTSIGVQAKCILMEYDSYERMEDLEVEYEAYENKTICFFASGNPLNERGIKDFLQYCWKDIIKVDPQMKLLIMGKICDKITKKHKNVTLVGSVSEDKLISNMRRSFVSINPVYLGTGLKIKSVDSICLGLPLVSFYCGIEGLEELEDIAFLRANDWEDFRDKILLLSRDKELWNRIRTDGKKNAKERFSKKAVYKDFINLICKIKEIEGRRSIKEETAFFRKDKVELYINNNFVGSTILLEEGEQLLRSKLKKGIFNKNIEIVISKNSDKDQILGQEMRINVRI